MIKKECIYVTSNIFLKAFYISLLLLLTLHYTWIKIKFYYGYINIRTKHSICGILSFTVLGIYVQPDVVSPSDKGFILKSKILRLQVKNYTAWIS